MIAVGLLTGPLWLSAAADASCAPPEITTGRRFEVAPGDELVVKGWFWTETCNDTPDDQGCGREEHEPLPTQNIRLLLVPKGGGDEVALGEVDADDNYEFRIEVIVPDVEPGRYVIEDAEGQSDFGPGSIRVRAR